MKIGSSDFLAQVKVAPKMSLEQCFMGGKTNFKCNHGEFLSVCLFSLIIEIDNPKRAISIHFLGRLRPG